MTRVKSLGNFAVLFVLSLTLSFVIGVKTALAEDGNISFTCPSAVNFVIKADGTLIGPSNAYLGSTSSAMHVEGVTTVPASPFSFKDNLTASDVNSVALNFGTSADTLHAGECLSGKTVTGDSWKIPAQGQCGLVFSGSTSSLSADVTSMTKFGDVIWNVAPDAFTVTYDANGGSGSMSADVVEPGDAYTAKTNGFTAPSGSVFDGWNTKADGSGTAYAVEAPVNVSADMTLYAQWSKAYAVLDDAGTLTLFRSANTYNAGTGQTVTDVAGNSYTGQVYTNIENQTGTSSTSVPWYNQRSSIQKATIASNQVISPVNCARWFASCSNLSDTSGLSLLDTSNVTNMSWMFYNCSGASFTAPDVSEWDTSKVTNMDRMFQGCSGAAFTAPDVSDWDTSHVTDMSYMFAQCSGVAFTAPDVSDWDTSSVTNMSYMFYQCYSDAFMAPDVRKWDTSHVTDMNGMFYQCFGVDFTAPDVSKWDTSSVTNMDFMFAYCSGAAFTAPDVSEWNTLNVTNMRYMFAYCSGAGFTSIDLSSWDISKVTNMSSMFDDCSNLETIYAASDADWNASATLTSHLDMFYGCTKLKGGNGTTYNSSYKDKTYARVDGLGGQPGYFTAIYRNGNAYAVLDDAGTLTLFRSENTYTAGWHVVTDVVGYTYGGQVYTDIENQTGISAYWYDQRKSIKKVTIAPNQVISPTNCAGWFEGCSNLSDTSGLSSLDTSNVTNMSGMFQYCQNAAFTAPDVSKWDTSKVTNMNNMFEYCSGAAFTAPDVSKWDTSSVTRMIYMFNGCYGAAFTAPDVSEWDTSSVTSMSYMFYNCHGDAFTAPDVSKWDTSKVTSMHWMFQSCYGAAFTAPDVSGWDTSSVTDMSYMFSNCFGDAFTAPDVSEWDTLKVTNMSYMFDGCSGDAFTAPDVSEWDTSKVTDMSYMFGGCSGDAFIAPDVSKWDTSSVTSMSHMFYRCSGAAFTVPDVSKWNTSNVTDMSMMFYDCSGIGFKSVDLSGWNISKVTGMYGIFRGCSNLETIYAAPDADWNASAILTSHPYMFTDCTKLKGGNGTTFNSSYVDKTYARVDGLNGQPGYFTAKRSAGTNSFNAPLTTMSALPKATAPKSLSNVLPSLEDTIKPDSSADTSDALKSDASKDDKSITDSNTAKPDSSSTFDTNVVNSDNKDTSDKKDGSSDATSDASKSSDSISDTNSLSDSTPGVPQQPSDSAKSGDGAASGGFASTTDNSSDMSSEPVKTPVVDTAKQNHETVAKELEAELSRDRKDTEGKDLPARDIKVSDKPFTVYSVTSTEDGWKLFWAELSPSVLSEHEVKTLEFEKTFDEKMLADMKLPEGAVLGSGEAVYADSITDHLSVIMDALKEAMPEHELVLAGSHVKVVLPEKPVGNVAFVIDVANLLSEPGADVSADSEPSAGSSTATDSTQSTISSEGSGTVTNSTQPTASSEGSSTITNSTQSTTSSEGSEGTMGVMSVIAPLQAVDDLLFAA